MTVCFETHPGICVNHREMLRVMRDLDHPRLRLNFDTANLLYFNENVYVEVALAKVCHLVKHVHLKDSMGQYQQRYFPALGCGGAVDFLRVYKILRDIRFPGPYSIEIGGIEGEPDLSLAEHHQRVVDSVKYLRELGYFDCGGGERSRGSEGQKIREAVRGARLPLSNGCSDRGRCGCRAEEIDPSERRGSQQEQCEQHRRTPGPGSIAPEDNHRDRQPDRTNDDEKVQQVENPDRRCAQRENNGQQIDAAIAQKDESRQLRKGSAGART